MYDFTREQIAKLPPEEVRPQPLISGDDLIAAGYSPGPLFKKILAAVEDGQLEGGLRTSEDALRFVQLRFPLASAE